MAVDGAIMQGHVLRGGRLHANGIDSRPSAQHDAHRGIRLTPGDGSFRRTGLKLLGNPVSPDLAD
jgi:hypothetical protein